MRASALGNLLLVTELLLLAGGQAASAQLLRGRVQDAGSRASIAVVDVALLTESGRVLARTQTDSTGAFVISWRNPDKVRLEARRIGFETTTTAFFVVDPEEVLTASVLLSAKPITVDPLIITSPSRVDEGNNGRA
ncbi:MAG: carboxypeptidase-like regulatory domain-containing protein, partial [Gemmatimonadota bacterium]